MKPGYTDNGITVRHLRNAIRAEIGVNAKLLKEIDRAAGGDFIAFLGEVHMTGHGSDFNLAFETTDDQAGRIWLDVPIDELRDGDISRFDLEREPVISRRTTGLSRTVTIAPEIWYYHQGNANSAVNPLTFEALAECVSPELKTILAHGVMRGQSTFNRLRRPKRKVPVWMWKRR